MLTNLSWLPEPPANFEEQLRALRTQIAEGVPGDLGSQINTLATAALDATKLHKLSRLTDDISKYHPRLENYQTLKLGLVGDGTLSLLGPAIAGTGLRHGLLLSVVEGEYNNSVREAIDPNSIVRVAGLDVAVIVSDARVLGLDQAADTNGDATRKVESAFSQIRMVAEGLKASVASTIFVQTVTPSLEPLFGSFDRLESTSPFAMVGALNGQLAAWAAEGAVVLIDVARLASTVGLEHWDDPRHWHASKLSFSPRMIPVYADVVVRTIAAARGKARKCLVLDLDNTLWGGVIGDDGVAGVKLGQGSGSGEAFLAVQRIALELRRRGVVLAVCSKNEDDAARLPFREHPEMLLREEHIAVFQANWTDKAANLRTIAETLNIGVDALVFLDDNPAERMQIRRELPMVAVPELPADPAFYPRILASAGYFEAVSFATEDRKRAEYYQANAKRAAALTSSGDIGGYLASLEMVCMIDLVDAISRPRVAQLINKSNQFNLTTRRYSESEVAATESDLSRHMVQIRLVDRFGDNGIIGVLIAAKESDRWEIDTWLMSCRVLGRRVEEACLAHLAAAAVGEGAKELIGRFIPSPKNKMVSDHYKKLGFSLLQARSDGETVWRLDLGEFCGPQLEMRVEDNALVARKVMA